MDALTALLDHLEETLEPEGITEWERSQKQALSWEEPDRLPLSVTYPYPEEQRFQPFPHGEALREPEKMLFNELLYAYETSPLCNQEMGGFSPLTIRPNFGIGLVAGSMGGTVGQMGDDPPWVSPFSSISEFEASIESGAEIRDFFHLDRVIECYEFYKETLSAYPALNQHCRIVLADLQGPFDNYELLRGADAFTDFYTDPELIHRGLSSVVGMMLNLSRLMAPYVTSSPEGLSYQHGFPMPEGILIRNDSAVMVSGEMYRDFIKPYDQMLLEQLGGGVHSCGDIKHQVENYLSLDHLGCLDLGQPLMNDRLHYYRLAKERGIPLIRMEVTAGEIESGWVREHFKTGVNLICRCPDRESAQAVLRSHAEAS